MLRRINMKHRELQGITDEGLKSSFEDLGKISYLSKSCLDKCLVMVFALVKEAMIRTMALKPYDEQIISAIAMHDDNIAEMKTGEGKTVAAVFVSVLYSLLGKVYICTVNDYLAIRDYSKMKPVYDFFSIACAVNAKNTPKSEIYKARVIYTASSSLIFDYLTEEIRSKNEEKYQKMLSLDTAILDEIDFILLDNANSSFTVSQGSQKPFKYYSIYKMMRKIVNSFSGGEISNRVSGAIDETCYMDADYIYSKGDKYVELTEKGIKKIEKYFGISNITSYLHIYQAAIYTIEASVFYIEGVNYILKEGKLCLINEASGRIMLNSHKEEGLQQAIEIKEGIRPTGEHTVGRSMTYQLFFNKFDKLTGMSGTVKEAEAEFKDIYKLSTYVVPIRIASQRNDLEDMIFKTSEEKYVKFIEVLTYYHFNQNPILVVTDTELEARQIYAKLLKKGFRPQILLNQSGEAEAEIIHLAGGHSVITITTNMAGRGTDIIPDALSIAQGGLAVILMNRFDNIRVDRQVRGRTGRQGLPGITICFSSLDDKIWTNLNISRFKQIKSIAYQRFYSKSMQKKLTFLLINLQKSINSNCYKQRKLNYEFDKILYGNLQHIYYYPAMFLSSFSSNSRLFIAKALQVCISSQHKAVSFLGVPLTRELSFEEIISQNLDRFNSKCDELGCLSAKLFESILNYHIDEGIADVKAELNNLKNDIQLRNIEPTRQIEAYIKHANECVEHFIAYITMKALEYFFSAEISRDNHIENRQA